MSKYVLEGSVKEISFEKKGVVLKLAPNAGFVVSRKDGGKDVQFVVLQPSERATEWMVCEIGKDSLISAEFDDMNLGLFELSKSVRVELDAESDDNKKIAIGTFKCGEKSWVITKLTVK